VVATPLPGGLRLGLKTDGAALIAIDFLPAGTPEQAPRDAVAAAVARQLAAYFGERALQFDLPLALHGSAHQRRVWLALQSIPAGETRTYGELAARLGSGARAVGAACRTNPLPIVVPCHRVLATAGLGGYMGAEHALDIKRWLLHHEGVGAPDA
jgi:methylated-DNA-[protein]-cysteine S-methyltransferase